MVEQGDILRITSIEYPVVVVSKNEYNTSGFVIVCPITPVSNSTLSYPCNTPAVKGHIQSDNLRMLNINNRSYSNIGRIDIATLLQVLSRVTCIFDII